MIDNNLWVECGECHAAGDIWYIDDLTGEEYVEPCRVCNGEGYFEVEEDED